ncbi:hypothetical protein MSAN_01907200 [Mycena sanguinolenta]|uniref:Uncharacterized protein n=1 Tax=Mycena sanguinolenta TaxID=230812 RepID=A0A8H6XS32_9AGAR|nr:hypothetical protein MSAN_01907200 [Mycena sanguinolenta]
MPSYPNGGDSPPDYTTEPGDDWAPSRTQNVSHTRSQSRGTASASEPRYVYYHVYAPDGMLRWLKNPCLTNPFVGRIKATSVPPPLTAASLRRAIVQAEGLPDPLGDLTSLFQTRDSRKAMNTSARVDIFGGELGATAKTAVALVFVTSPKKSLVVTSENDAQDYFGNELPQLHYRLYNRGGEAQSVRPLDWNEPSLGRIKRELICPPRNALCVKRRIAKLEGKPIYQFADLFTGVGADNPHPSDGFMNDRIGSNQENPILIVQPERRPGLYNRPVQIVALPPGVDPRYWGWDSKWLRPSPGDILQTDGVARTEKDSYSSSYVYTAVDTSGRQGWISAHSAHSRLLDEPESSCSIQ